MGAPTEKMKSCARRIQFWTQKPYPFKVFLDFEICSEYISTNIEHSIAAEKAWIRAMEKLGRNGWLLRRPDQCCHGCDGDAFNEHCIGDEDSGVTIYDCGVYPEGNS